MIRFSLISITTETLGQTCKQEVSGTQIVTIAQDTDGEGGKCANMTSLPVWHTLLAPPPYYI